MDVIGTEDVSREMFLENEDVWDVPIREYSPRHLWFNLRIFRSTCMVLSQILFITQV